MKDGLNWPNGTLIIRIQEMCIPAFRYAAQRFSAANEYSKTCLKWPLKKNTKVGFLYRSPLNAGQK